jgi:hypothetical protein
MWVSIPPDAKSVLAGLEWSVAGIGDDGSRPHDSFKYVCAIGARHRNVAPHPLALRADGVYLR